MFPPSRLYWSIIKSNLWQIKFLHFIFVYKTNGWHTRRSDLDIPSCQKRFAILIINLLIIMVIKATLKMTLMSLMTLMTLMSRDLPSCLPPPSSVERYIAVPLSATEQYLISSSGQVHHRHHHHGSLHCHLYCHLPPQGLPHRTAATLDASPNHLSNSHGKKNTNQPYTKSWWSSATIGGP